VFARDAMIADFSADEVAQARCLTWRDIVGKGYSW
jgi:hypothetical protein